MNPDRVALNLIHRVDELQSQPSGIPWWILILHDQIPAPEVGGLPPLVIIDQIVVSRRKIGLFNGIGDEKLGAKWIGNHCTLVNLLFSEYGLPAACETGGDR